jgi:hypothetical protein
VKLFGLIAATLLFWIVGVLKFTSRTGMSPAGMAQIKAEILYLMGLTTFYLFAMMSFDSAGQSPLSD